jgi:cytochrome c oxidase subunit III
MGTLVNQPRPVLDVSGTPTVVFGHRAIVWWGQTLMMVIEGTMFAILIASYFFLRTRETDWPPGFALPALKWGTINLIILLLSAIPNAWIKKRAEDGNLGAVRIGMVIMGVIAIVNCMIRALEFPSLNCVWDGNAYGSAVWTLLGFHTFHLVADTCDSLVLTVLMFVGPIEGRRYDDVSINSIYWYFIIGSYIATYAVIYLAPRWL